MKIKTTVQVIKAMQDKGIQVPPSVDRYFGWGDDHKLELDSRNLNAEQVVFMREYYRAHPEVEFAKGTNIQLAVLLDIWVNPTKKIGRLDILEEALIDYLKKDALKYWLFKVDHEGNLMPVFVNKIEYKEADSRNDRPASCTMSTCWLYAGAVRESSHTWHSTELGADVATLLETAGYVKENPAFLADYNVVYERYVEFRNMFGMQFLGTGRASEAGDRWSRSVTYLNRDNVPCKMVNDEEDRKQKEASESPVKNSRTWTGFDATYEIPIHPYVYMFHLETHTHFWVHANQLEIYQYDKELKNKLVLPDDIRDLLDILTEDMDVLMDDIIAGKTGGTIMLLKGQPGTGKTLTAEVYSEIIERPLYKVQSFQLGVGAKTLEENLKVILARASRWGAILLIDEADVYIYERGADINQNAIVGVFLRTLEYYSGLLVMTTNRGTLVDDAILSRCTAVIEYKTPSHDGAVEIWRVLSTQYQMDMPKGLCEDLVEAFPTISGRSIKNLLKLTSKYCRKREVELSLAAFKHSAAYLPIEGK